MEEVKPPSLEDAFGDLKDPRTSSLRSGPETMAGLAQRIHLDPIGGIAGDMFVAALADAFPTLIPGLLAEVEKLPAPARAEIDLIEHRDAVLGGHRFLVAEPTAAHHHHYHGDHQHDGGHAHEHGAHAHTDYADIRRLLHEAPLRTPVREHALRLFALLAETEAEVHGIKLDAGSISRGRRLGLHRGFRGSGLYD